MLLALPGKPGSQSVDARSVLHKQKNNLEQNKSSIVRLFIVSHYLGV